MLIHRACENTDAFRSLEHVKNNYIKYDYTFVTYKTHTQ